MLKDTVYNMKPKHSISGISLIAVRDVFNLSNCFKVCFGGLGLPSAESGGYRVCSRGFHC